MGVELPCESVHPPTSPCAGVTGYPECFGCGYDLSGIAADGRCPECATPVSRTLQGDGLRFSPPAHLATLKHGATLVAAGVLAWLVLKSGAFATSIVTGRWLDDPPPDPHPALSWLTGAALLVALYGWWRIAAPDPSSFASRRRLSGRRAFRCVILCAGAATVANRALPDSVPLVVFATHVIWLLQLTASMFYIRHLAGRIPDVPLQRLALLPLGIAMLMLVPCLGVMLITMLLGPWAINLFVLVTALCFRTAVDRLLRPFEVRWRSILPCDGRQAT